MIPRKDRDELWEKLHGGVMTTGVIYLNSTYLEVVEDLVDCILFRVRFYLALCSLPGACKSTDDRPVWFQLRLFNDADLQSSNGTVYGLTSVLTKSVWFWKVRN